MKLIIIIMNHIFFIINYYNTSDINKMIYLMFWDLLISTKQK